MAYWRLLPVVSLAAVLLLAMAGRLQGASVSLESSLFRTAYQFGATREQRIAAELPKLPTIVPGSTVLDVVALQLRNRGSGRITTLQESQLKWISGAYSFTSPGGIDDPSLTFLLYDSEANNVLISIAAVGVTALLKGGIVNTNSSGGFSFRPDDVTLTFRSVSGTVLGRTFTLSKTSIKLPSEYSPVVEGVAVLQAKKLMISAAIHGRVFIGDVLSELGSEFEQYTEPAGNSFIDYRITYFASGWLTSGISLT